MSKKIRRICPIGTGYSLFLYLLIKGYDEDDFFIFLKAVPKEIRNNFNHTFSFAFYYTINFMSLKKFIISLVLKIGSYFVNFYSVMKLRTILFFKTKNCDVEAYGHGHLPISFPLYEYENASIIEDGLANYADLKKPTNHNSIVEKLRNFFGIYIDEMYEGFGTHENISKVYLTCDKGPEIIKDKVEVIDMRRLWDAKSQIEKDKIIASFNLTNFTKYMDKKVILLLTEPLSEHNHMPIEEEIEIYQYFLDKYKNENVIIKTHPRETKDYTKIFPDVPLISVPVPVELLCLMGFNIEKIVTVCSTAALTLCENFEYDCEIYENQTSSKIINDAIELLKDKIY